ncbi:MAG: hypothetical protein KBD37_05690 [Burkholderiales bacterium]|nr:hypothetical protein [Burkholderiales bacterium]
MTNQVSVIHKLSPTAEVYLLKAVESYLRIVLHSPPGRLYVIRKEWVLLTEEQKLLLELFKEAKDGGLNKAALFAKDPFKPLRDEIARSHHEIVPAINKDFDNILTTVINAGIICSGNAQLAELLKCHISHNYFTHKFRTLFEVGEFDLLQFELRNKFYYRGNLIIVDLVFISIFEFFLCEIRKNGSGKILIRDEEWAKKKIVEFECTLTSAKETIEHVFDKPTENGVDFSFCKKAMQLFGGDMTVSLNDKGSIVFTLTFIENQ